MSAYEVQWRYADTQQVHSEIVWAITADHARNAFEPGHNEIILDVIKR